MRVAVISLSSCLGCQMVFLGMGEYLYDFIGDNNVVYAPLIMDEKELPEIELALVEGTVRDGSHFKRAREVREKASLVVALGTCACFGGVQGLANRFSDEALQRKRFSTGPRVAGEPPGVRRLLPLDAYIKVDGFLPGCPVPAELLRSFLKMMSSGSLPKRESGTVCSECRVSSPPLPQAGPNRLVEAEPEEGKCLLEQGLICMGPLTRDGCGARCPSEFGVPCIGCRGPSDKALISPCEDLRMETERRLARATGSRIEEVQRKITDPIHSFFKFCMAEPLLRRKRPGGTAPYLHRLGGRE